MAIGLDIHAERDLMVRTYLAGTQTARTSGTIFQPGSRSLIWRMTAAI